MSSVNELNVGELLEAQTHVWSHTFNFIKSMSLKCAIDLGIPDIIHNHGQPMALSKLVSALSINPKRGHCMYRLMRILVHSGLFTQQKVCPIDIDENQEEGYVLTNASYLLLRDNPFGARPISLMLLDPDLIKPWHDWGAWFQNDDPTPYYMAHGKTLWEHAEDEPRINNLFNEAMASDTRFSVSLVTSKCKSVFEGLKSLVDVGGGTGTVAKAIAQAFPHLECTVLDLPHVVADLQDNNNLKYVGGDMFEAVPPGDAVFLKWILHDWDDEACVQILKRCKDAITSNEDKEGKVIIIDIVIGYEDPCNQIEGLIEAQIMFDMLMMVVVQGQERNEEEWAKLFFEAGFSNYKIYPILGLRSLIEVYP